ncbi:hypothetical protein AVEN_195724-1 [Araneus ventricosus]|uniref:Uncharacterized protein n=1 Tax=Araneus ventricosus TaxID=182803 RepID=A0A4Y2TFG1_ARAVE|nr:hypothetical protein AVEN_190014-1 [Araneus ventricosus]GBN99386.1 hypothetical protein AVEN_195724-1 [Araneus ventricosus]
MTSALPPRTESWIRHCDALNVLQRESPSPSELNGNRAADDTSLGPRKQINCKERKSPSLVQQLRLRLMVVHHLFCSLKLLIPTLDGILTWSLKISILWEENLFRVL